jgi:Fur family transcriptional regulator, ferric uptake regulator
VSSYHKLFETYLAKHEGRYTVQKQIIVDEIIKTKHHFEVEDFIDKIRASEHRLSRATLYRTIKQLLDAQLLQKISTQDGKVYYEQSKEKKQHDHLICNTCGKIIEIKDDTIEAHLLEHCNSKGFIPQYRSLHIYGKCKQCVQKEK